LHFIQLFWLLFGKVTCFAQIIMPNVSYELRFQPIAASQAFNFYAGAQQVRYLGTELDDASELAMQTEA
jgi:hypothetical protein